MVAHSVRNLLEDRSDVGGYFQGWSLDNFEWKFRYRPKWGVAGADQRTFERSLKPIAHWHAGATRAFASSTSS